MTNSRSKGKRGELEFCRWLQDRGVVARRGRQYAGHPEAPDVVTGLEGLHFEVKRTERLRLYEAVDQARSDCGDQTPVVAHKCNRREWLAVLSMEDFLELAKQAEGK